MRRSQNATPARGRSQALDALQSNMTSGFGLGGQGIAGCLGRPCGFEERGTSAQAGAWSAKTQAPAASVACRTEPRQEVACEFEPRRHVGKVFGDAKSVLSIQSVDSRIALDEMDDA